MSRILCNRVFTFSLVTTPNHALRYSLLGAWGFLQVVPVREPFDTKDQTQVSM